MSISKVMEELERFFETHLYPVFKITTVKPTEQGWFAVVEIIEERQYMKIHAKDEMLGIYHVQLNKEIEVEFFERKSLRPRSAVVNADE